MKNFHTQSICVKLVAVLFLVMLISTCRFASADNPFDRGGEDRPNCSERIASTKPGTCPPPHMAGFCASCNDRCHSDNECPDQQKCCPQPGCGNMCRHCEQSGQS